MGSRPARLRQHPRSPARAPSRLAADREVALEPAATFHFHTGRSLARRLGYAAAAVEALPDRAVESFAGVGNPFALRRLLPGERVVDVGAGAGFDAFIDAAQVGQHGRVVGVDMTPEMLDKARATARLLGPEYIEFRQGSASEGAVASGVLVAR